MPVITVRNPLYDPNVKLFPSGDDIYIRTALLGDVIARWSSPFGEWRGTHKHGGDDLAIPEGTVLKAPSKLRNVLFFPATGERDEDGRWIGAAGLGNYATAQLVYPVLEDAGWKMSILVAHLHENSRLVTNSIPFGDTAAFKDSWALSGNTGFSTGPHTHVAVSLVRIDEPFDFRIGNPSLRSFVELIQLKTIEVIGVDDTVSDDPPVDEADLPPAEPGTAPQVTWSRADVETIVTNTWNSGWTTGRSFATSRLGDELAVIRGAASPALAQDAIDMLIEGS